MSTNKVSATNVRAGNVSARMDGLMPWQVEPAGELLAAFTSGSLHHAHIVFGHASCGRRRFAREIAAALLCQGERAADAISSAGEPARTLRCGKCRACLLLAAQTHPDLYELTPPEGKKIIPIDAVRELQSKLQQTAQMQAAKVCLIWPAEALNENAANALLKLLEEPPANTYFLLLASSAQKLLPTINSRCLKIHLPLPARAAVEAWLKQAHPAAAVAEALRLSRGYPEKALAILELDTAPAELETLADKLLSGNTTADLAARIESVNLELLLEALVYRVHQKSLACLSTTSLPSTSQARAAGAGAGSAELPSRLPLHSWLSLQAWLGGTRAKLASNPNRKLYIDALLLGIRRHMAGAVLENQPN